MPAEILLEINDKEIMAAVRKESYSFFVDSILSGGIVVIQSLIAQGKLGEDTLEQVGMILKSEEGSNLYRGIPPEGLSLITSTGNDKTTQNSSPAELAKLKLLGFTPEQVLYADLTLKKAWAFVKDNNPSMIVLYDGTMLERIKDEPYLYKLRYGRDFRTAVKAIVTVSYG